eukprot:NODE_10_length_47437_cov_0.363429.p25 type:complete len:146 gc:universal NODE_10_length_47437_cov_0.363429:6024-5587(-)
MSATEEQVTEWKEAFSLYDKEGKGFIPSASLGNVLRAVGQNPTEAQVKVLAADTTKLSFDQVLSIVQRQGGFDLPGTYEQFVRGFQVFDRENNGFITVAELRYVLTNLGEKLSEDEFEELLKLVDVQKDGTVNYHDLVRTITSSG